ncbi:MAG: hypothetical protein IPN68_06285 [Bacteroidetes bacterium]|nr:hypothetical protein [Bacteroidota bacterium]
MDPMITMHYFRKTLFVILLITGGFILRGQNKSPEIKFVDYYFENGSPLNWKIVNDTLVISLLPDYQRETLNRQTDHWYFKIITNKGTRIKLTIEKMVPDVYNGKPATDWWNYRTGIPCYVSYDNKNWKALKTSTLPGRELYLELIPEADEIYLARLPVYTTADLKSLLDRTKGRKGIEVIDIGKTVEKRPLEIIRLGDPSAKFQIVIRARAHPWEPGGNWVVEGLIDEFIREYGKNAMNNFCFSILPMANKDGVVRGMTRFNVAGMDLNRAWDKAPDSLLCPENYVFVNYITSLIIKGTPPVLVIDLHNDDKGDVHLTNRDRNDIQYKQNMERFEKLMRQHTSFSESFRYIWNDNGQPVVWTINNGLYNRYGLESFVYELNANWISGLGRIPSAEEWKDTGKGLLHVLLDYY